MLSNVILALLLGQGGVVPLQNAPLPPSVPPSLAPPPPPMPSLDAPEAIAEPDRLAITPVVDGRLDTEEWDPFFSQGNLTSYFEWEPGAIHVAAQLPVGTDLLVSINPKADGWLTGSGNIEVRVVLQNGQPVVMCRGLDNHGGAHWFDRLDYVQSAQVASSVTGGTWTVELTLNDPGTGTLPVKPGPFALRVDAVPTGAPLPDAFVPRTLSTVNLVLDRTAGLPTGLEWKPQISAKDRSVNPGAALTIRHTFRANPDIQLTRVDMRNEGGLRDLSARVASPFPGLNNKWRGYVDYHTTISPDAPLGWYVHRLALTAGDGITSLIQSSFYVAPLVTFELTKADTLEADHASIVRFPYYVHSHSDERLDGVVTVTPPGDWRVVSAPSTSFTLFQGRLRVRESFQVEIPSHAIGAFPVKLTADIGGRIVNQIVWVRVHPVPK